jgi:uncharacterized protein with NRDE domain
MCTIVLLRRPGHDWPLILGANRDEMAARPSKAPARHWPDRPEVVAGLDVEAGGSWLGVNDAGVTAAMLNRHGTLGRAKGFRSRGELVLEALDHGDAVEAARALKHLEPGAYRPFNMIIADNRDAFWLRHADPTGTLGLTVTPIGEGLSMLTAGELDDPEVSRIRRYRPLFAKAKAPDPDRNEFCPWQALLESREAGAEDGPTGAMRFVTETGFDTVSSAIVALAQPAHGKRRWVFRFASWAPEIEGWKEITP